LGVICTKPAESVYAAIMVEFVVATIFRILTTVQYCAIYTTITICASISTIRILSALTANTFAWIILRLNIAVYIFRMQKLSI